MAGAPPPHLRRRALGVILCVAAAAALAFSLATRAWWTHRIHFDTSIDVGPWSGRVCVGDYSNRYLDRPHSPSPADPRVETWVACTTQRLGDIAEHLSADRDWFIIDDVWGSTGGGGGHWRFARFGMLVLGLGLAAMLALVGAAIAGAAGARRAVWRWPAHAAAWTSGGFLVVAVLFVLVAPAEIDQMSLDLGFTLALAGGGFGVAAGRLLAAWEDEYGVDWRPVARTTRFWRAVAVLAAGVIATGIGLHARIWWVDDNPNYLSKHGIRDGESCEVNGDGDRDCEIETWNSQPEGATGKRPLKWLVAFRASEAAYQLGHLAVLLAVLLLFLLAQGRAIGGRWAPHRILAATAIGFVVAAVVLAIGSVPDSMDSRAVLSIGPMVAIGGGALLVWGAIATARLLRAPPPGPPLPPARLHDR